MAERPSRNEKLEEALKETLALYVSQESNRTSLITITRVRLDRGGSLALCYVSVLPEHTGPSAVDFLSRKTEEARAYLRKRVRLGRLPQIQFHLDDAERTRRIIDSLNPEA